MESLSTLDTLQQIKELSAHKDILHRFLCVCVTEIAQPTRLGKDEYSTIVTCAKYDGMMELINHVNNKFNI